MKYSMFIKVEKGFIEVLSMTNIIIGAGPAGRLAALELGILEEEVLLIEKKHIAGTCLNEGCMVVCALTDIARFLNNKKHYESLGLMKGNIEISYNKITSKIKKTQEILRKINQEENESVNNKIIYGKANIDDSNAYVNGESYAFENLLIATGSRPFIPDIQGVQYALTSSDILEIEKVPEKLNIIGGGIIAAEVSNIFSSLGSEVNIIARSSFLKELDSEIRSYIMNHLYTGVNINENTDILEIKKNKIIIKDNEFEGQSFIATGRIPNSEIVNDIVELNKDSSIKVNEMLETSTPNIYAAGDVTGGLNLTPIARMEGITAARNMAGYPTKVEYKNIPQSLTLNMDVSFTSSNMNNGIYNNNKIANQKPDHNDDKISDNHDPNPDNLNDEIESISFPGLAGPGSFWNILGQNTGLSKISVNTKTNEIDSINAISPSSVSDVSYLSFLMRINEDLDKFDEFIEIHPSTDAFYKIMKYII
ncbi:MAG: NAD(P)/FAD-dependent oxidoreductase [Methanobacteriaceae archaeon]|jgi:dihydrolipoamide dehydrogenase|nr:NAD(P)/FAD-dependent oxidoreductase [Candidatus Methanorudis spinitermitis]